MLENVDNFKVIELCRRFDELKDLGYNKEKIIDDVLFDDDFSYCLDEEIYEVYDYWKTNKEYKETHRKFRFYMREVSNDESEFQLVFEIDGKVKNIKTEYSVENCLIDSFDFFHENCEKYLFDGRFDSLDYKLNFQLGM